MTGKHINDYARSILAAPRGSSRAGCGAPGRIRCRRWWAGLKVTQFNIERDPAGLPAAPRAPKIFRGTGHTAAGDRDGLFRPSCEGVLRRATCRPALGGLGGDTGSLRAGSRDGRTYIDGGMYNPVPFDLLQGKADIVIAVDVVGAPQEAAGRKPTSIDLMFGATQLLMRVDHRAQDGAVCAGHPAASAGIQIPGARLPEDRCADGRDGVRSRTS